MGVSSFLVIVVDVDLHTDIASAFEIHRWNILGVQDADSNLVVEFWLGSDIPNFLFSFVALFFLRFDFEPASDHTL